VRLQLESPFAEQNLGRHHKGSRFSTPTLIQKQPENDTLRDGVTPRLAFH
jgi:hypothetical protein